MPDHVEVVHVEVYHREIERIQHMPAVTSALRRQASAIANRGRALAGIGETASSIFVEEGVRPKGRPYARAVSDPGRQTRGYAKNQRRALLQRAADIRT